MADKTSPRKEEEDEVLESSDDDSDDLDDVPLSLPRQNNRYGDAQPSTSPLALKSPQLPGLGLSRLGATPSPGASGPPRGSGFKLNLPIRSPNLGASSPGDSGPEPERSRHYSPPKTVRGGGERDREREPPPPLLTSRGPPKPPKLNLINAASASPVPSGNNTPWASAAVNNSLAALAMDGREASLALSASSFGSFSGSIAVDLLSTAFTLENLQDEELAAASTSGNSGSGSQVSAAELIKRRCCASLGVAHEDLTLYEIRPIESLDAITSCSRVGVMVTRSGA